jgi:WD40 repeat protein
VSRTGNNIASVVFVLVLALFVSQPILNASRSGPPADGGAAAATTTTTQPEEPSTTEPATTVPEETTTTTTVPEPEPSESESPDTGVASLVGEYPAECLKKVARPNPGFIAALGQGGVTVASPSGSAVARFKADAPIQWSPSGRFLAAGDGEALSPEGNSVGPLFSSASSKWAWSPRSDCALGIVDGALEYGSPGGESATLVEGEVTSFAFSPDGSFLAYVALEGGTPNVYSADLRVGAVQKYGSPGSAEATIFGWSGKGTLLYGGAAGASVAADGERLIEAQAGGASSGATRKLRATALKSPDSVKACRKRTLLVVGGGRETTNGKRLAYLSKKPHPRVITAGGTAYSSATCSPKLDFIAAVAQADGSDVSTRKLTLLRGDGSVVQQLTADSLSDDYPLWGPSGTGIAFVRIPAGGGTPQVWYLPEGRSAANTGLTLKNRSAPYGYFGWSELLDWSADVPTGMPPQGP